MYHPSETDLCKAAAAVAKSPTRLVTVIAEPGSQIMGAKEIENLG